MIFGHCCAMKTQMEKKPRLTKAEIETRLDEEWREVLKASGLISSFADIKRGLRELDLSPEIDLGSGFTLGMSLGLVNAGKILARKVKTEVELEEALQKIKEAGEKMPTAVRKAMKEVARSLPRRGGPGRRPKLSPKEASVMCDQIALFIRQKYGLKEALKKAADLSPSILGGKKVSARTLQKAWGRRGEYTSEQG